MTDAEKRLLEAVLSGESRDIEDLKEKVRRERCSPEKRAEMLRCAIEMRRAHKAWDAAAHGYGPDVRMPILEEAERVPL
jgi:hypothetical protein